MRGLSVNGVSKSFGRRMALSELTFTVNPGTIYGLIGPDGAGKTTMFRIIASLMLPDEGKVDLGGINVLKEYRKVRRIIGYMPGKFSLYPDLTVEENLKFFARIFGVRIRDNYDLIRPMYKSLEPFQDRKARDLSGGMKQKLALSCALIHRPEFLLLDEPTTGVDPVSRQEFWDGLIALRETGLTILVSTAYMDEATRCDEISLIQDGSILETGKPSVLIEGYPVDLWTVSAMDRTGLLRWLKGYGDVEFSYPQGEKVAFVPRGDFDATKFNNTAHDAGLNLNDVSQAVPTIEDVFLYKMRLADDQ